MKNRIRDELNRIRRLSGQAQQLIALKNRVASDFDKGYLTHERLDIYLKEREAILQNVQGDLE